MGWIWKVALGLSLAANVVVGIVLVNHVGWIEDINNDADRVEAHVDAVDEEVARVSIRERALSAKVGGIRSFDPSELAGLRSDISLLKSDVRFLERTDADTLKVLQAIAGTGGTIDASAIDPPPFCLAGDPAYWDFGGLTC